MTERPFDGECEFCGDPLEEYRFIAGSVDSAYCSWCRQPHKMTDEGTWVAVDRF